jgi:hypothetical protein
MVQETLAFFDGVKKMLEEGREILTPQFARPRMLPDILFAIWGNNGVYLRNCVEAYEVCADQWIKVSSTQI